MYQVDLTDNFFLSPSAWRNFFMQIGELPNDIGVHRIAFVNKKLEPWGGRYENGPHRVIFETEQQMMYWLLKWS